MDDLISRQAAMKAVCIADCLGECNWYPCAKIKALLDLPSAQPGWISVTERLPEKDGEYLVTIDWGDGDTEVDCYDYCANGTDWNDGDLFGAKVLAWMPLPEPWEGGQDGTD